MDLRAAMATTNACRYYKEKEVVGETERRQKKIKDGGQC